MNGYYFNQFIGYLQLVYEQLNKPDCKERVSIIFEVIKEYVQHQIDTRRKKIDFITENYNLIRHKSKRDEMSMYVTEIQELNQLLIELSKVFNRVIELSK